MDDVEYILRIVLKARDDMALVLAKARRELRGFTADADKMNTSVASLNKAMGEFNNNMDGVTKKLEGWRAILRDAADDSKKSAKSLDSLTKAAEKNARVSKQSVETQKQLQDRARALRGEVDKITKARTAESISADLAVTKYRALAKALEEVSLKMSKAARERTPAHRWAADASEAADEIKQTDKDITNDALVERKRRDAELAKTEAIRLANVKRHNKQVEDEILASIDRLEGDQKEAERLRLANVKSHNKGVENEILDSIKRLEENQKEAEYIRLANVKRHNKQVEDEILGAITKLEGDQKEVERLRLTNVKRHNKEVEDEILASIISLEQSQKEVERLRLANVKRHNKEVEDEISASIDKLEEDQKEAERLRLANVKRHNKQVEDEILRQIERQEKAEALRVAIVKLSNAQISREIEQQIKDEEQASKQRIKLAEKEAALQERITRVNQRASAVRGRVASGSHDRGDVGELRRIAAEQNSIANAFAVGSDEARHFNAEAEHSRDVLRSITRESERTSASTKKLSERFHGAGASVAGFDNQLRGLGILAAVVSIQQLISAAIALGGELVSLAGSAVMAGGALGGVLAAGAAQALPVIGLLAGAFQRVKSVIDAVQQSQKLQQAQFTDAEKGSQKAADQTYKLANANDAVAAANDNLAESRKNLTQAQKEGVDQLQDLILAERQAGLAARGAALDVKSAQEALRLAIAGGASQLEIDQKRLAVDEARNGQSRAGVTLQRATRDRQAAGGDVNKLDSVKQAAKSVDDAEKAVKRANRGLDQAEEKTARVASTTMTAAANLDFLLSQLSPAERRLYDAATSLYESYKKIFQGTGTGGSGIYGVIIDAFARAVTKVESIMEMPKVIAGIQGLANVIGQNIDKIVGAIDPKTIDQLLTIIGDAGDNMGPLVDLAIKLAKAFLNIAETANPAFQNLIKYIGPIVDKFLGLTADKDKMEDFFKSGEKHLESWLDLIGAVIGLFVALTGASADSGKTSIEDLTKKIQGYTDWIDSHHDQVVGFFEDAREAAYAIGGVLENLAVTLAKSFSSDRVKQFADILNKVVIPALAGVIETLGRVVDEVSNLIDSPLGVKVAKWAVGLFLLAKVASSITGVFGMFWKLIGNVVGAGEKLVDTFKFLGGAASKFLGVMTRLATALQVAGAMTSGLSGKAGILGKVLEGLGRMIPFIFGPWGIVIAAVIIGVGLLLKHFGKLDDVWNAIKKATKGFMKDIEPAIKALQDALEGLGIKVSSIHDVLKFLERAGKVLADFIATYLIGYIEGFFKILAGVVTFVVRVIAGLIEILHGLADILIGIFTLDGDQIKKGFKGLVDGIVDIFWGIVDGLKLVFEGILKIMLAPFKAAWNAIKEFFGVASPSKLAKKLGEAIIDGIVAGIKGAAHALSQLADWIWGKIRNGLKSLGRSIKGAANWLIDKFVDYIRAEVKGLKAIGEWIWNAIRASIRAYASLYKTIVSWLWDKFTDYLKLEIKSFKKIGEWIYNAMSDGIHTIGDKLESLGKRLIDAVIRGIKKAPKAISDAIDWLLDKVPGGGAVKKGLQALGAVEQRLPGFAQGGPVPGTGSGDTVPARLTPGEHVLTKQEVAAAGGHGTIFAIRRLLGGGGQALGSGFQTGGAVYDPRTGLMHGGVTPPTLPVADDAKQREAYKHSTTERANNWRIMWNDMLTTARRSANDIEKQFRDMRVNTANSTDRMYREVRGSIADIQNSFNVRGKIIVDNWADNWLSLMKVTAEGLFYIGHETNKALTSLGEKYISFGFTAPKKSTEGKAIGGWIGKQGERGKDAGMFALGRGEAVLNWGHQAYVEPAMNAYYGHGLGTMFDRVRGYHAGGPGQAGFAAGKPNFYGRPTNVTQGIKDLIALMQQHFPLLQVTSTTNHGKYTTTGNISDHGSGHAVDLASGDYGYMTKAAAWILSSGLYKRLKQGIHNPNLAVNAGQRQDPPGQFAGRTWGEHANHIHLALADALGKFAGGDLAALIGRGIVTPRGSARSRYVQASLDRVRKSANKKISEVDPGGDAESYPATKGAISASEFGNVVRKALGILNIKSGIAEWVRTMTRQAIHESTLTPGARNDTPDGKAAGNPKGILQVVDGTFAAYKEPGHNNVFNALDNTLASIKYVISRYGGGNAARAVSTLWARGGGAYAQGGIIDGPDGSPTPILAHAGEWVLNKGQQLRAAMLSGLSIPGLRSMLGFHGKGGVWGYAGGTKVDKRITSAFSARSDDLTDNLLQGVGESMADLRSLAKALSAVKNITRSVKPVIDLIELATKEKGFLDQLRSSIERQFARAALGLRRQQYKVDEKTGKVTRDSKLTDVEIAKSARDDFRGQRDELKGERRTIQDELGTVSGKLALTGKRRVTGDARAKLQAQQVDLNKRLADSQERIVQNTEDIFNAQEDLKKAQEDAAQKRKDDFQKEVDKVKDKFTKESSKNDRAKRIASALGSPKLVDTANQAAEETLHNNLGALQKKLKEAKKGGFKEIAADLEDDIAELQTQIVELAQQKLRDAADAIGTAATRRNTVNDLFGRMADAMGIVGNVVQAVMPGAKGVGSLGAMSRGQVAQDRIDSARQEQADYIGLLGKAQKAGNVGLAQELTDKINELTVVIVEQTKAARDAAIATSTEAFDFASSLNDLNTQLVTATDAVSGQTSTAELLRLAQEKLTLQQERTNELQTQYNDAVAVGDVKASNDLQKALLESRIAVQNNTKALNDLSGAGTAPSSFTSTAWQWFRSAFLTGTGGVMPQYTAPTMANLSSIGPNGTTSSTTNGGNTINTSIEINEAGQPIDATQIASTVVFAQATAQ